MPAATPRLCRGLRRQLTRPTLPDVMELTPEQRVRFLSLASHDLRGILANVRTWAAILASGRVPLDERGKRATEVILRNTDRALAQQQALFDLLRAEWAPMPVAREARPLAPLLASALGEDLPKVFPETLPEVTVDEDRLGHVIHAFTAHARARAAGGSFSIRAEPSEDGVWISFLDSGAPLDGPQRARAFDPVARALEEQKLGTGFDLGVAAEELAAMGGRVRAGSSPDGGTVHAFWLPSAPEAGTQAGGSPSAGVSG